MLEAVRPHAAHVGFEIPGPQVIHRDPDATLVAPGVTTATVSLHSDSVSLTFEPALLFVIHAGRLGFMVEDVRWRAANYRFGGTASARLERVPAWLAFDLASATVRQRIEQLITDMFAGTPFAERGYDPFRDEAIATHLEQLRARMGGSAGASTPSVPVGVRTAGASVMLLDGLVHREEGATIRIRAGARVRVSVWLRPPVDVQRLVAIDRARIDIQPAIELEVGEEVIGLSGFSMKVEACGPSIRVEPTDVNFVRYGRASTTFAALGALIGMLSELSTSSSAQDLVRGATLGPMALHSVTAGVLSRRLTLAAGLALERVRPRLKDAVPLVDWDALLCTPTGRPVLSGPLHGPR